MHVYKSMWGESDSKIKNKKNKSKRQIKGEITKTKLPVAKKRKC